MELKRVVEMCMNNPQTGGEEDPLNSQPQKLVVGAPTDTSWAPRAHGVSRKVTLHPVCTGSGPRVHGTPRAHKVPRDNPM